MNRLQEGLLEPSSPADYSWPLGFNKDDIILAKLAQFSQVH